MNIKKSILIRVRIAFLGVVAFAICVAAKVGHIQMVEGDKWAKMAEETMFDYKKVEATRGNIYSENGSLLATSLPFYKVAMDPTLPKDEVFKKGVDSLAYHLSKYYKDKSKKEYAEMLKDARATGKQYITINRKQINYQTKKEMSAWPIFREGRYKGGVIFEKMDVRYRPFLNWRAAPLGLSTKTKKEPVLSLASMKRLVARMGKRSFKKLPEAHGSRCMMATTSKPWMALTSKRPSTSTCKT